MADKSDPPDASAAQGAADRAAREEEGLRDRWEATQVAFRQRFDEPISRATTITRNTLAWFPVRVWRHFLITNGFLLAAGVSYQALFASFAAIYVAFAIAGLWLGGSPEAIQAMINIINSYIPGIISESGGLATPEQVAEIATSSAGGLAITGIIALGAVIWTAIGFVTYARRAVRDIFSIPPDRRSYLLLKSRDLLAAIIFGVALVLGALLGSFASWVVDLVFSTVGWGTDSAIAVGSAHVAAVVVSFVLNSAALAALFRFLTGASLQWRAIWPGALLGGGAITVLQLGAGLLLSYTPSNPLLATFAIFVGLLLWFRIIGIIMLVAAAWIAVAAQDRNIPLLPTTEAERLATEHQALVVAAQVRLRTAQEAQAQAPWIRAWAAGRAVREAEDELEQVKAAAPVLPKRKNSLLD